MYAAGNGHALAVEALLAGGADVGQVNPKVRRREGVGGSTMGGVGGGWFDPLGVVSFLVLLSSEWGAWPPADGTPSTAPQTLPSTALRM
jgi:hypothetical protein